MTRPLLLALLTTGLLLAFNPAHAQSQDHPEGNKADGRAFVYTCAGCHGVPGYQNAYPTYHVPRIAGQNGQYITDALHEYQKGVRKHPTMNAQAEAMNDQDISNIAAYLSSLRPADYIAPDKASKEQIAQLARVQKAAAELPGAQKATTCEACHGQHGIAIAPNYPNLAGQYADYIVQVLHEYKDGQRDNAIMKGMASQLSDQDMQDIAAYFAAQPPVLDNLKHHIQGTD